MIKLIRIETIDQVFNVFKAQLQSGDSNVYRGTKEYPHSLKTSIERNMLENTISTYGTAGLERINLRTFYRSKHLYIENPIFNEDDLIEVLAAIQHYGGPTRLLDFSYSLAIGLHFAFTDFKSSHSPTVWALNLKMIRSKVLKITAEYQSSVKNWEKQLIDISSPELPLTSENTIGKANYTFSDVLFLQLKIGLMLVNPLSPIPRIDCVTDVEPLRLNRRMLMQNGLFLMPLNSRKTFLGNLSGMFSIDFEDPIKNQSMPMEDASVETIASSLSNNLLTILSFDGSLSAKIGSLLESMNVRDQALFPDFIGLATSLKKHKFGRE